MISYNGLKRFTITEYGHEVPNFKSWQDYLDFQSKLKERELNKQKFDFQISRFQAKSKYLPYILSLLSLIVAVLAYIKSLDRQDSTQSMPDSTERTKDSISISTPTRTTDSTHISKTPVDSLKKD
ncbi:hypothetical protein [Ulvibacterium marinum]|nr:hypothetical protein [Ulvibacterium marinum]